MEVVVPAVNMKKLNKLVVDINGAEIGIQNCEAHYLGVKISDTFDRKIFHRKGHVPHKETLLGK